MRQAELKPELSPSLFLAFEAGEDNDSTSRKPAMNISRRRSSDTPKVVNQKPKDSNDYFDDILDDGDLIAAGTCTPEWI